MPRAREHSRELTKAFNHVRYFLICIGQMPFEVKHKDDGTVTFRFNKSSFFAILFFIVFLLSTLNYIFVCSGAMIFFFGFDKKIATKKIPVLQTAGISNVTNPTQIQSKHILWELHYVQREVVTIVIVWTWMTIALVGSSYVLFNGKYYVRYFNYWNKVVQVMDMDVTQGIKEYLYFENIFLLCMVITLSTLYGIKGVHIISETSAVVANFYFRSFGIEIAKNFEQTATQPIDFQMYRVVGFLIMVYAYVGSRANMIQFLFFVRCLTNASRIWNERLKTLLTRKGELTQEEMTARRLDHRLILKDHYTIVQLYKMTDNVFSRVLMFYFTFQIMTFVLELYQLASLRLAADELPPFIAVRNTSISTTTTTTGPGRVQSTTTKPKFLTDENDIRKEEEDWERSVQTAFVVMVILVQGIFFAMFITRAAARAYEEAMGGFQILRRTNYLCCNSKTERNFIHSLVFSYARNNPLNVTASGFFTVDKTLIPSLVGTVLNYVVAIYTLQPDRGSFFTQSVPVIVPDTTRPNLTIINSTITATTLSLTTTT